MHQRAPPQVVALQRRVKELDSLLRRVRDCEATARRERDDANRAVAAHREELISVTSQLDRVRSDYQLLITRHRAVTRQLERLQELQFAETRRIV